MNDPYTDPKTGVLRNKLGITTPAELAAAEADITAARLLRLAEKPLPGKYDLAHLQKFHKEIFGSIYPWAGEIRSVEISKENFLFCAARMIPDYAASIFGPLARADHLRNLSRDAFLAKAADLYGDVNALHPFREGNGRTQRAFLAQLAGEAGHPISWSGMDRERNRLASIASHVGEVGPFRAMLADLIAPQPAVRTAPSGSALRPTPTVPLVEPPPSQRVSAADRAPSPRR